METAFDAVRKGLYGAGLGQPRRAFHQQVAVSQQGDQQALYEPRLADDLLLQPALQFCNAFPVHKHGLPQPPMNLKRETPLTQSL